MAWRWPPCESRLIYRRLGKLIVLEDASTRACSKERGEKVLLNEYFLELFLIQVYSPEDLWKFLSPRQEFSFSSFSFFFFFFFFKVRIESWLLVLLLYLETNKETSLLGSLSISTRM